MKSGRGGLDAGRVEGVFHLFSRSMLTSRRLHVSKRVRVGAVLAPYWACWCWLGCFSRCFDYRLFCFIEENGCDFDGGSNCVSSSCTKISGIRPPTDSRFTSSLYKIKGQEKASVTLIRPGELWTITSMRCTSYNNRFSFQKRDCAHSPPISLHLISDPQ